MSRPDTIHLVVPGPLDQRTGGYLYDARIVAELRTAGRRMTVHEVEGRFPDVDTRALAALDESLASIDEGEAVVVDGLALGAAPEVAERHARRLRLVGLVHHPLADETGLEAEARRRFEASERVALGHVRGVIVTSPYTASRLQDFGVAPADIRPVLPGTDPGPLAEGAAEGEAPRLVCVGTVTPRKGHDVLVRALARIDDLEWRCDCAGSLERAPEFVRRVRSAVERLRLVERVRFLGELSAEVLDEVYRTGTLFVLPSHYEGYGMAFAEALARGLPVVGTTGGAIPHTVPDGAGILVEPGDADALADALRALLEDGERRQAMARAARRHARSLPDWGQQARAFAAAVDELVGAAETSPVDESRPAEESPDVGRAGRLES
ncbi:MAG: glycosyltransferase family 4 protein [Longimicrobiales bacterium]|nr:glycosyltransferase family 4 protein [Longimicrobiales bacterium]